MLECHVTQGLSKLLVPVFAMDILGLSYRFWGGKTKRQNHGHDLVLAQKFHIAEMVSAGAPL